MGVPSKYLLFPVESLGTAETVTLKRARRVRPQRTKKERRSVSRGVRRPRAKAQMVGATPKEICGRGGRNQLRLAFGEMALQVAPHAVCWVVAIWPHTGQWLCREARPWIDVPNPLMNLAPAP